MSRIMYAVYPQDSIHQAFILWCMGKQRLIVMQQYADLVCQRCGKVDERAALARGIQASVTVKSKRPFLGSDDDFYLLDERAKKAISGILPEYIEYYRLPSSPYYVACAKVWMEP